VGDHVIPLYTAGNLDETYPSHYTDVDGQNAGNASFALLGKQISAAKVLLLNQTPVYLSAHHL
jgi:hypothetical protein